MLIVPRQVVEEKLCQKPKSLVEALTILDTDLEVRSYAFLIPENRVYSGKNSILIYNGTLSIKEIGRPTAPYELYLKKLISALFKPVSSKAVVHVENEGMHIGNYSDFDIGLILHFPKEKCKELEKWQPPSRAPKEVKALQYILD
jgi:hypothetical protein